MRSERSERSENCAVVLRADYLARVRQWLRALGRSWRSHPSRQLRLRETLALGERRFLAVVEFERQKFLIAGTGNSVAMLTTLPAESSAKDNQEPRAVREDVPTWKFTGEGPFGQLVRR
jgi:flagellar biogenesis protein FliO